MTDDAGGRDERDAPRGRADRRRLPYFVPFAWPWLFVPDEDPDEPGRRD